MIIKYIYTLFLGLMLALFVGLGIDAFYQSPKAPEYPVDLQGPRPVDYQETGQEKNLRLKYDQQQKEYDRQAKSYNRNVSIISLLASVIILIASLTLLGRIKMIADGILLGGVFTACYAIIRGLMADSSLFRFLVVAIGLIIALVLGYIKFIRPKENRANQEENR